MVLEKAVSNFIHHLVVKERSKATTSGYRNVLNALCCFLETRFGRMVNVEEITLADLEEYLEYHQKKGNQALTRNRIIYIIRSFYNYLHNRELVENNISKRLESIPVKEKERIFLVQEEITQLIENIDHKLVRTAVITLANTGLRISELSNLKLTDVDFETRIIKVREGKGNKDRIVPINQMLMKVLSHYLYEIRPNVKSDNFFATARTGKLSRQTVNEHLLATVKKLGWEKHVTAHILRHSFASALVSHNVSLSAVQKLLGHSDLKVTSRYIHQNIEQLHVAVNHICEDDDHVEKGEPPLLRAEIKQATQDNKDILDDFLYDCRLGIKQILEEIENLGNHYGVTDSESKQKEIVVINEQISIGLSKALLSMVEDFSKRTRMSKEELVESAIIEFLKEHG
ncbi:tyrosine-type recombinase/integrase [Acetobacterium paludosum]|uniref:Tyrosine-type recombinase/integrase n=1 Tax=Acetobacterium paludosum TaxID=52693 RepID=A0A923HXH4_9FIRM|nr:tyrosine-type recombinase/integrase [Acetobacterium paludosum]MBC3887786.1 tyrosine-type recombinase/integrase [Acetobacterium paludosum]